MSEQKHPHWFPDYEDDATPVSYIEPLAMEAGMRLRMIHEMLLEIGERTSPDANAGDHIYVAAGLTKDTEEIVEAMHKCAWDAIMAEKKIAAGAGQ